MSVGWGLFWCGLFIGLGLFVGLASAGGAIGNALKARADTVPSALREEIVNVLRQGHKSERMVS